jgi:hypothetical protein
VVALGAAALAAAALEAGALGAVTGALGAVTGAGLFRGGGLMVGGMLVVEDMLLFEGRVLLDTISAQCVGNAGGAYPAAPIAAVILYILPSKLTTSSTVYVLKLSKSGVEDMLLFEGRVLLDTISAQCVGNAGGAYPAAPIAAVILYVLPSKLTTSSTVYVLKLSKSGTVAVDCPPRRLRFLGIFYNYATKILSPST